MSLEFRVGPTVGRESALEQIDATLDALEAGSPTASRSTASPESARRISSRSCTAGRRSAGASSRWLGDGVRARPRSASGPTHWTPTSPRRSSSSASRGPRSTRGELDDILPSLRRRPEPPSRRSRRAVPRPPGLPRSCSSSSRGNARSSSCSTTSTGPTRHRSSCSPRSCDAAPDAPVLLALAFRRAQAPVRLSAALATPRARLIALEPLAEAEVSELLADVEPRPPRRSPVTAAATRSTSTSSGAQARRTAGRGADESGADAAVAGMPVPSAVAASLAEELASLPVEELVLLRAAAVAGEPFEPDLAAAIAELPPSDGLDALDALLALDLVRPTSVPRRFVFRHRSCATRGLRVRARRLEARGTRTRGSSAGAPRGARRPSAPTTPSSTQGRATRRRSASCWRPEPPRRRGRRPRRRAGSSRRCACCPPATNGRSTCALPLRRRCAPG